MDFLDITHLEIFKQGRLKLNSNPQIFQLNEIILGIANFDVVKEMISSSLRSNNKIPLDATLENIVLQRSFMPMLPSDSGENLSSHDKLLNLDYRKMPSLHFEVVPDIVITPSILPPFVKTLNNTLFINPSTAMKGNSLGSFIRMFVFPPSQFTGTSVFPRLKIDLCNIQD